MPRSFLLLAAWLLSSGAARADAGAPIALSLIPQPARMEAGEGSFIVDSTTPLRHRGDGAEAVTSYLADLLARTDGPHLHPATATEPGKPGIDFVIDATQAIPDEGYRLDVAADGIRVLAREPSGLFYGATTLWQLLTESQGDRIVLPVLHIEDAPRFAWRGYMLDSARNFHTVEQVKKILDTMALHKLNVFHWHLTDDQGWRIQIKRYPKLTEAGGCRIPAGDAGINPATGKPVRYCGWYTQDDIRDVVAYAAARHITVVPEIDVPGHATAAIAAYSQLGTEGKKIPVTAFRGIHSNLFNVEEGTFAFLDNVFTEVARLFPGPYVHVGGDEAIKDQWKASQRVQQRMHQLGLKDESDLQGWFIRRLEKVLVAKRKRLIGWDEILEGGLPAEATVMSWRGTEGGIEAAKQGHDVVMSPTSALYFDYLQTDSPNEYPGRPAPRLLPMQKVYEFEPVPGELDAAQRKHILGLQANMWTTDNRSFAGVEHNTFPRLLAVAETGWTPKDGKDYARFLQRLPAWLSRYRRLGIGYARTPFEVMLDATPAAEASRVRIALSNPLGYAIHYTLDGSDPGPTSPLYREPLTLKLPTQLRSAAFSGDSMLNPAERFDIDAASLLTRNDEQLQPCTSDGPVLRMEDDGPANGGRALFNVAIMAPCWQWKEAPLKGIGTIEIRAGRLPYIFNQRPDEDAARKYLPAKSAHGELDVRLDSCDGETIATVPLPAQADADGFITLRAAVNRRFDAPHALCIRFSGDFRPRMWVLDRVTLAPIP